MWQSVFSGDGRPGFIGSSPIPRDSHPDARLVLGVLDDPTVIEQRSLLMPLCVVGSVALDSVETPTQRRDNVLGGSAVFFSYAASFFTSVRLAGVVGEDWPAENTAMLKARGIDTAALQVV